MYIYIYIYIYIYNNVHDMYVYLSMYVYAPPPSAQHPRRRLDTVDFRNLIVFFWAETLAH